MYYFAWVGPDDDNFQASYQRMDEDVFSYELDHAEASFPSLVLEIKNPRRKFIASGQDIWAWFTRDDTPLFYGRLVAMPEQITDEIVRLTFIARPRGYDDLKRSLADSMKVPPFWDPVWISEDRMDDSDVVWEAYPELWHVDRTTLALTSSSIIHGEDGTIEFFPDDFAYDGLSVNYGLAPLRKIKVEAEISWDQQVTGTLDISQQIVGAFQAAGSRPPLISSYTGQGLEADWPEDESNIGGGWHVHRTVLERADGVWVAANHIDVPVSSLQSSSTEEGADAEAFFSTPFRARFFLWEFKPTFVLGYEVSRSYIEKVSFEVEADVQPVYTDPGDEEITHLSLSSRRVSEPLEEGGQPPLGDLSRNSYIRTSRGRRSLEYLIAVARAELLARSRAVEVSIEVPIERALDLSCRKSAIINDSRLPGGQVAGKIISYRMSLSGESGREFATLTIGCTVGYGNTVEATEGEPTYVEEGYEVGYQFRTAANYAPIAGEVTYTDFSNVEVQDDGIDFGRMRPSDVIIDLHVINGEEVQVGVLAQSYQDIPAVVEALNAVHTEVWLELKPLVGGPFETEYHIAMSKLMIPKTVEL